jgi:GDP-L-fucose synthase
MIEAKIIDAANRNGGNKLLFLWTICINPKLAAQPMLEEALIECDHKPTNKPYGIAKIAGIMLCESYNR